MKTRKNGTQRKEEWGESSTQNEKKKRSNAVNAAKTKYIVFRTRGKIINPLDCNLVFNNNEIGVQNDPELIYPIERIYNDGDQEL
jgi:hypothetical protein